jgi:predicted metal-dependent peptidase
MALSSMPKAVPSDQLPAGIDMAWQKTKAGLFYNKRCSGFLGRMLTTVELRWTNEIQTAAISLKNLFWNPEFFMSLDKESRITVLAHELWHKGFLHHGRVGTRCPDIWNIAGDHVINLRLQEDGFYMDGFPYLMDRQYSGMHTEAVYDHLQKNPGQPTDSPLEGDMAPNFSDGDEGDVGMTDDEIAQAVADVVSAVTVSKMTGGSHAGSVPGEVTQIIDEFLNPRLPWDHILVNHFNVMVEDGYSYARPNRRYEDIVMPGRTGRNGLEHLIWGIDISGSIVDQTIQRFFSEGKDVQERLEPERMTIVTFDTEIHDIYELERGDPFGKFEITGRGGTDLNELFAYATKQEATALVIFTDLYVDIPPDPGFPIIWICIDNDEPEVPYGKLIVFSENKPVSV